MCYYNALPDSYKLVIIMKYENININNTLTFLKCSIWKYSIQDTLSRERKRIKLTSHNQNKFETININQFAV